MYPRLVSHNNNNYDSEPFYSFKWKKEKTWISGEIKVGFEHFHSEYILFLYFREKFSISICSMRVHFEAILNYFLLRKKLCYKNEYWAELPVLVKVLHLSPCLEWSVCKNALFVCSELSRLKSYLVVRMSVALLEATWLKIACHIRMYSLLFASKL